MLNDRQLNIVNDLEQTDQLITANSLAEKYYEFTYNPHKAVCYDCQFA